MVWISVIIPVYNVEKYLKECLDSVLNQTFDDIEVICVNDGSTDSSPEILKTYENDSRVKIITQENKGAGASRNVGLSEACGEYVYFMDSDDYLNLNAFQKLYDNYHDSSADFIIFKLNNFFEDSGEILDDDYYNMPLLKKSVGENPFDYDDISDFALRLCVCPPGNLFRREFIKDIRFPQDLLFEDNVFFTKALFKAERIYFYDEYLYNRRRRSDSTTTPISVRSMDTIEITNMLIDLCNEYGHTKHMEELYYRIFHNIYDIFKRADSGQKEELFEKIKSEYVKNREKWESDDYFSNNLKPEYRHMFNCALKSPDARKFEKCVERFNSKNKLMRKLHEII